MRVTGTRSREHDERGDREPHRLAQLLLTGDALPALYYLARR